MSSSDQDRQRNRKIAENEADRQVIGDLVRTHMEEHSGQSCECIAGVSGAATTPAATEDASEAMTRWNSGSRS